MNEDLLQFLWKFKLFDTANLRTTDGQAIEIRNVGMHNENEGPDFLNASLVFDNMLWQGPIELHLRSSDWKLHGHSAHPLYQNIIAHVVYEHDRELPFFTEKNIPTIELKNLIPKSYIEKYEYLSGSLQSIPCADRVSEVIEKVPIQSLYTQKILEKWEHSLKAIQEIYEELGNDWEATLFTRMAYGLGLKINAEIYADLAKSIPYKVIQKTAGNELDIIALLHGKAGLLAQPQDDFQADLKKRYDYLKHKFKLPKREFYPKFLRLRPPAFPTIRLALLANIYHQTPQLFTAIQNIKSLKEMQNLLQKVKANSYFDTHYIYGKESRKTAKKLSKNLMNSLMINVLIPIQFAYLKSIGKDFSHLLDIMEELPKEQNNIVQKFESLDFPNQNALDSQALIALYKNACSQKKCLLCNIGLQLMKNDT